MSFSTPAALIFLLVLPFVWWLGWPRQRFRRRRDISSLLLRTLIIVLLVFSVAGVQVVRAVDRLAVVFLVDVSDSMGADALDAQREAIQTALENKHPDDLWSLVVFGADVSVEQTFTTLAESSPIRSTVVSNQTDLAAALQTALSLFPADTTRRIVVLSDGAQTLGDAVAKAELASASGIEISTLPFVREPVPDVRVADLSAPARVPEGQAFDITVTLEAEEATPATLLVFSRGRLIHEAALALQAGETRYALAQTSDDGGFLDFSARVVVEGANDNFTQNNQLGAFTQIVGPPRVLLIASQPEDIVHLIPTLENAGLQVDVREPGNLPPETSALATYKSVVLVNVPASDWTRAQMERLDTYVSDLGGGLVFIGGPDSYGPGGYFQTPLERTLPVEMQIRDQQRLPQLTLAYLIDRSGSMAMTSDGGVPNIELAKEAIIRSLEFLQPTDRAAIGTFDNDSAWVAPFQDVFNRRELQARVASLRPGGGTDILAGLRLVRDDIVQEESERKHVLLLTDGGSTARGLVEIAAELHEQHEVTLSVISIGNQPPGFLEDMAEIAEGNYYQVSDTAEIPTIFTQETVLATRSYILEEPFTPVLSANSPIMAGIGSAPQLGGYVATTPKSATQVVLRGPEPYRDPILAAWQYGLGRAVAFTSDATTRWASDWVGWDGFTRFWGQAVSWTITEGASANLETRVVMEGEDAVILVDARDEDGAFLNNLDLTGSLVTPDNQALRQPLRQTAPGRYEARFVPDDEGAYFVTISGTGEIDGNPTRFNEVNGWVMSYSPEYAPDPNQGALLGDLARITGGRDLSDDPGAAFINDLDPRVTTAPIWPFLLMLALLLLPFDIAVRRLIVTRSDLQRLRQYLFAREAQPVPAEQASMMSSLMGARERAREQTSYGAEEASEPDTSQAPPQAPGGTVANLRRSRQQREASAPAPRPDAPAPPKDVPSPPPPARGRREPNPEDNIGSRLLKKRRRDDD